MRATPVTMPPARQIRKAEPEADLASSLARELEMARAEASSLRRELSNREFDLNAFEGRIAAVESEAARGVAESERRALEAEQRVLAIHQSSSWRLTGPFRRAVRLARRLLTRG